MTKHRWKKWAFVVLGGGVLIQFTGCASTLAPIFLSLAESTILSLLTGGLL